MNLELHATPEEVMRAVEALQTLGEELNLDAKTIFGLSLALEECGSNIVNHALQRDAARTFPDRLGLALPEDLHQQDRIAAALVPRAAVQSGLGAEVFVPAPSIPNVRHLPASASAFW